MPDNDHPGVHDARAGSDLSVSQLMSEIRDQVTLLVRKQLVLAKTELRADIKDEAVMAGGLGVAALLGILTLATLFVTAIFALGLVMPGWAAGLIVTGFLLLSTGGAAAFGWSRRVRAPLRNTRETLKEDLRWTKHRLA
jgi:uncharacterized membrane protein YqjE